MATLNNQMVPQTNRLSHHCHHRQQTSIEATFYFWFLGGQEFLIIADEDLAALQTSHDRCISER